MDKVKVAVVGCGSIAQGMHLPGLKEMEALGKVELVAVCDMLELMARSVAAQFGVPTYYTNFDKMLAQADFDLLMNLTIIQNHFAVSLAALRAGKHVYTQKPMTTTVEDATTLVDEARARGLRLAAAPEHPISPTNVTIGSLVADGAIGRVNFARVMSSHWGPEKQEGPAVDRRDSSHFFRVGSGPLYDMGVHGLSQITGILGPAKRVTCVSGRTSPVRHYTGGTRKGQAIPVEVDDNTLLFLDFGDASYAILDATYCVGATLGPRLEIYGAEGVIALTGRPPKWSVQLYELKTKEWREIETPERGPVRDLGVQSLVDCLREDRPLKLTGERGRHLVEIMAKAPEAARLGQTLELTTTF